MLKVIRQTANLPAKRIQSVSAPTGKPVPTAGFIDSIAAHERDSCCTLATRTFYR